MFGGAGRRERAGQTEDNDFFAFGHVFNLESIRADAAAFCFNLDEFIQGPVRQTITDFDGHDYLRIYFDHAKNNYRPLEMLSSKWLS